MTFNLPAISDEKAMLDYPTVRNAERDALLALVEIKEGGRVLDVQSSSGYLSEEIYRRLNGNVECYCLEPSQILRARLPSYFISVDNPVEQFSSIENETMDTVLGLAGLHHSKSHLKTISESFRVLKTDGWCAYCDVVVGSNIAHWLNEFVHEHHSSGHHGHFVEPGSMASFFREVGFKEVEETCQDVPWVFKNREDISKFFKGLFGLNCSESKIDSVLDDYFEIKCHPSYLELEWRLAYCRGTKRC